MAAETFSASITAADLGNAQEPKVITIGDSGGFCHAARLQSMMNNTQIVCKGPDGQLARYTIDPTHFWDGRYKLLKVT